MTLSEYTKLKQQIVFNVGKSDNHHHLLHKLKEYYRDDIDSERRFEEVNTIGHLLKILQVREVLSEDNVGPLREIARCLNNNELLEKISDYEKNHVEREYINYYAIKDKQPVPRKEFKESEYNGHTSNHPYGKLSLAKRQRINKTIEEEIGKFWRDLARNLKIREGQIDEIDSNHQKTTDKAKEVLHEYYDKKSDPQRWFLVLCEALEKSRRKDIRKSIEEIMAMNF